MHFDDHQFELLRQDGWKKLRPNAIPTIFAHSAPVRVRKPPVKRNPQVSPSKQVPQKRVRIEHSYFSNSAMVLPLSTSESVHPPGESDVCLLCYIENDSLHVCDIDVFYIDV